MVMEAPFSIFTADRLFINIGDSLHEVQVYYEGMKLRKDFGYLRNGVVFIYKGKIRSLREAEDPGLYKLMNGELVFILPDIKDIQKYKAENITELAIDKIFHDVSTNYDKFITPKEIEIINNNSEIYVPEINPDDDFLKVAVKKVIAGKKINPKNYKDKLPKEHSLSNLRSGLKNKTKMTTPNFVSWMEILSCDWKLTVFDNGGDTMSPLPRAVTITSEDF